MEKMTLNDDDNDDINAKQCCSWRWWRD